MADICKFGNRCNNQRCNRRHITGQPQSPNHQQLQYQRQTINNTNVQYQQQSPYHRQTINKDNVPCKYGNNCRNSNCGFKHASVNTNGIQHPCKFGLTCKFLTSCKFAHYNISSWPVCEYNPYCKRPGCTYKHPFIKRDTSNIPCRNGRRCTIDGCAFKHPLYWNPVTAGQDCKKSDNCDNKECPYKHSIEWMA
jgi:hypothetical protein